MTWCIFEWYFIVILPQNLSKIVWKENIFVFFCYIFVKKQGSCAHVVDDEQVVQVAAYNSTGVSFGNDLILDDHFAFIVGTNEETRFYHNGTDTIVKHLGFNDSKFKIQHENTDRFVMDTSGVQLFGNYTLNGQSVSTQTEVDDVHARINDLDSDLQEVTELLQELLQFRQ